MDKLDDYVKYFPNLISPEECAALMKNFDDPATTKEMGTMVSAGKKVEESAVKFVEEARIPPGSPFDDALRRITTNTVKNVLAQPLIILDQGVISSIWSCGTLVGSCAFNQIRSRLHRIC